MPNKDGTGPNGKGPRTGRQLGKCEDVEPQGRGFGRGQGQGRGQGNTPRRGMGRGCGCRWD